MQDNSATRHKYRNIVNLFTWHKKVPSEIIIKLLDTVHHYNFFQGQNAHWYMFYKHNEKPEVLGW